MFSITHRDVGGKTSLYAHVLRMDDGKYWDESADAWVATESGMCNVSLAEDTTMPGRYAGSANFNPSHGTTYDISIFEADGTMIVKTSQPYVSDKKTALQLVNDIQQELRLPKSADFTAPHAKSVLAQLNKAIQVMNESDGWPEMNVKGSFMTKVGVSVYSLRPINASYVDILKRMQIGTNVPLAKRTDGNFKTLQKMNTAPAQPTDYRIFGRAGGVLIVELTPAPDIAYQVDFELLMRNELLAAVTDIPLLDTNAIYIGGLAFTKKDQGSWYQDDMALFQNLVSAHADNQSEPNWGDAETI